MKVEFEINIKASNSVGTAMSFKVAGKGDNLDYSLASLKVSNKLYELAQEELSSSIVTLLSLKK